MLTFINYATQILLPWAFDQKQQSLRMAGLPVFSAMYLSTPRLNGDNSRQNIFTLNKLMPDSPT